MSGDDHTAYTLDGRPVDASTAAWARPAERPRVGRVGDWNSSSTSRSGSSNRGIGTLANTGGPTEGAGRGGPSRSRRDSDDEDENKDLNWFAGGERSGLSIQNPASADRGAAQNFVRDIMRQATQSAVEPSSRPGRSHLFAGGGHTLGSDDVPSEFIPDPDAPEEEDDLLVVNVTFWRQGFQVEDGEFLRYDEPQNAEILAQINRGIAPPSLINVRQDQPVEFRVSKRTDEDYIPTRKAFSGAGHRLGAPVPLAGRSPSGAAPAASPQPAQERESITTRFEVDQTLPTTSIQIRLTDGTRMVARMNLAHTVGDIRSFINASRPENRTRAYTMSTTFPNRVLDNDNVTIEDAKLQNSVIVQRWV